MCGLFGALCLTPNARIASSTLIDLSSQAGRRGPQAWGMTWAGEDGSLHAIRKVGRLMEDAATLPQQFPLADCCALIGQARLTTSGTYQILENNQPLFSEGEQVALAHNGTVRNAEELTRDCALALQTGNDSEVLLRLIERRLLEQGQLDDAVAWALSLLLPDAPYALLVLTPNRVVAARRGLPLFFVEEAGLGQVLFCSRQYNPLLQALAEETPRSWAVDRRCRLPEAIETGRGQR